jgi:hypothetical protein
MKSKINAEFKYRTMGIEQDSKSTGDILPSGVIAILTVLRPSNNNIGAKLSSSADVTYLKLFWSQ